MSHYAQNTSVSSEKSRAEIERTLRRYGATGFGYAWEDEGARAMVGFVLRGRRVRFMLPMPDPKSVEFTRTPTGKARAPDAAAKEWEQAGKQRWRALALMIKAKLEAVESGIVTLEDEFLAHLVLPNGQTVGERIGPEYIKAIESGGSPPSLLPAP